MIQEVKAWWRQWRRRAAADKAAWKAFCSAYPHRRLIRWRMAQHRLSTGQLIVTVCFGNTRPPDRSWWIRKNDQVPFEEIPGEEAAQLIDIPKWR